MCSSHPAWALSADCPLGWSLPLVPESQPKLGDEAQGGGELSWVHTAGWTLPPPSPGYLPTNSLAYLSMSIFARDAVMGHPSPGFAFSDSHETCPERQLLPF